jgi:hypothetical protein
MMEKTMSKPETLHDALLQATYTEKAFQPFRAPLIQARKFVLDDKMSSFMADIGNEAWKILSEQITDDKRSRIDAEAERLIDGARKMARLPFPIVWIEYDSDARRRRWNELYAKNSSLMGGWSKGGWLLEQISSEEIRFTHFSTHSTEGVSVCPFSTVYSTSDESVKQPSILRDLFPKASREDVVEYTSRIATGVNVYRTECIAFVPNGLTKLNDANTIAVFLKEGKAELRYVWTMLSTINDVPVGFQEVKVSKGFMGKGQYRKYLSYSRVTINIPKKKDVRKLARRVVMLSKVKRHEVRGHYRRVGIEKIRKWVNSFERGDASLGWAMDWRSRR